MKFSGLFSNVSVLDIFCFPLQIHSPPFSTQLCAPRGWSVWTTLSTSLSSGWAQPMGGTGKKPEGGRRERFGYLCPGSPSAWSLTTSYNCLCKVITLVRQPFPNSYPLCVPATAPSPQPFRWKGHPTLGSLGRLHYSFWFSRPARVSLSNPFLLRLPTLSVPSLSRTLTDTCIFLQLTWLIRVPNKTHRLHLIFFLVCAARHAGS